MSFFKSGGKPLFDVLELLISNISNFIVNIGSLLADIAAELGPWFAPAAPAMFSYIHLTEYFNFSNGTAIPVALSIEFVGLAVTNTIVNAWLHNRRETAKKNQIPLNWLVLIFAWYLFSVIGLNVALTFAIEFLSEGKAYASDIAFSVIVVSVQALVVLIEVPAAAVIAFRTSYRSLLSTISSERRLKRSSVSVPKMKVKPETEMKVKPKHGSKKELVKQYLGEHQEATIAEIKDFFSSKGIKMSTGTISEARTEWSEK